MMVVLTCGKARFRLCDDESDGGKFEWKRKIVLLFIVMSRQESQSI